MALLGGIENTILVKILGKCAQLGFKELSKTFTFYKLLVELDLAHPKNEFEALYMQTCLILSGRGCHDELVSLFLLEDSKEAFKAEKQHKVDGAFRSSLDGSLHTSPLVKELKDLDSFPDSEINNFLQEYDSLTSSVASPVDTLILGRQKDTFESLNSHISASRSFEEKVLNKLELLSPKSDDGSLVEKENERQIRIILESLEKGMVDLALSQFLKLKEDIWDKASNLIKYKLLTNIGICNYRKRNNKEASKALIDAYSFNQESEIAFSNIVNGFIAVDDYENAKKYYSKFVEKFPESPLAIACFIRLQEESKELDLIESEVPDSLKNNEDVLLALGLHARNNGLFDRSISFIKKALENNSGTKTLEEHLLTSFLMKYQDDFRIVNLRIIDSRCVEELNEALEICDKLITKYKDGDLTETTAQLLMNKSILLDLIGNSNESVKTVNEALALNPSDPVLLRHKGISLALNGEFSLARDTLAKIKDLRGIPDTVGLLASILKQEGKQIEAIDLIEDYLGSGADDDEIKHLVEGLLIDLYIETKNLEKIQKFIDNNDSPKTVLETITVSKAKRFIGNKEEAVQLLIQEKHSLDSDVTDKERYLLAEELISTRNETHAIDILEDIVDKNVENHVTTRLINLYYEIGEKGKSLEILKNLRLKNGPLHQSTEFEVSLYQQYHDYATAKSVAKDYLTCFPRAMSMRLRMAGIDFRLENYDELEEYLSENIDYFQFSYEEFESYLGLLMTRNFRDKVFHIVYEYRRKRNDSKAHILYLKILLQFPLTKEECKPPEKVMNGSVVSLENNASNIQHFIIEDRPENELVENEINLADEKYGLLKNKNFGDKIQFKSSTTKWKIKSISNKYVFAFQESQLKCETLYSEQNPFTTIHTDDLNDFINQLQKDGEPWQKSYKEAQNLYRMKNVPIGVIASSFGKNPISLWDEFRASKDIGIQTSFGNSTEMEEIFKNLKKKKSICIDIIGLITLFELGIGKELFDYFGSLKIAPTTKDLILDFKQEIGVFNACSTTDGGKNWIDLFQDFVNVYCEEELPNSVYQINDKEKAKMDELIGTPFIDSILLCKEKNYILLTDDLQLRRFADGEYEVEGCWTQSVIRFLFLEKQIDNDVYQNAVIQLTSLNYLHTSIDDFTLVSATKKSNSSFDSPITSCLRYLNGDISSEESSIQVATFFLYRIRGDKEHKGFNVSMLTHNTISALCVKRTIMDVIDKVEGMIIMMYNHRNELESKNICKSIWEDIQNWKHVNGVSETPITRQIKQAKNISN